MANEDRFLADVLAHIEAHLFEPLSLAQLAALAGLSPYHFSRAFTARLGSSVMDHVRARRLEAAYMRLSGSSPPALIDLAFDCGFDSQEAFTRAFRRRYGIAPGQFRRSTQQQKRPGDMPDSVIADVKKLPNMARGAFRLAGPRVVFDGDNKTGIPALWPRLIRSLPLPGQVGMNTYGAVWAVDRQEGRFQYMAAVEVAGDTPLPDGLEYLDLAPQTYAVFRLTVDGSPLQPQMLAAMSLIWGELLPASGVQVVPAPDLEIYPEDFNPQRKGSYVDICIPIKA